MVVLIGLVFWVFLVGDGFSGLIDFVFDLVFWLFMFGLSLDFRVGILVIFRLVCCVWVLYKVVFEI